MTPRMPFGKYYGQPLTELPDGYLEWLVARDWLRDPLLSAARAEWERRRSQDRDPAAKHLDPALADQLITAGLHSLARRHHPDLGGDPETMVSVNNVVDWLRQQIRNLL